MVEKEVTRLVMKALLEGYPYLKQIFENIHQVVWVLDLITDQIIYSSPAFELVWGRSCESLYTEPLSLINSVHTEDRVKVMSASASDKRQYVIQSFRIIRPDGSLRWISAQIFFLGEEPENPTYQVCIAQDITDQNQVDQNLRKALERSREQFILSHRMSLARKPEAVLNTLMSASELRIAKRGFVLFFEALAKDTFRYIHVTASWPSFSNLTATNPTDTSNDADLFEELALSDLFQSSKPVIVTEISKDQRLTSIARNLLLEWQIRTMAIFPLIALGNWLGSLLVLFPKETQFEPVELRHIKVLVDQATITLYNLRLLEIEADSRREAERANEVKTRFLAMISHELRTPLTSIKGFTTTLLAEDVVWEPEEQRDFIKTIQQEANRLQELIDQLLDLPRLEAGMLPIEIQPHSLQEIMEDVLPQFHALTSRHKLTLCLPENLPLVYADARRIAQVMVNLVRNASSYTPKETEINISASVRGGFVQVNVNDQGPGISPAEHERVFNAFQRGANVENGAAQGAGLGLAICKGLIEAHGGRIWIKKKSTSGATISFTLKRVPMHTSATSEDTER